MSARNARTISCYETSEMDPIWWQLDAIVWEAEDMENTTQEINWEA